MKLNTSFLKRCIALVVALVLLVSCSNLGSVLRAFAAEDESVTITDGKLVAMSYELTAAEKALLSSGLLKGAVHTYTVPTSDKLVTIKLEQKMIEAADYEDWKPVAAHIIVDNVTKETVKFADGKAAFTYAGDAFTVEVDYELNYVVDKEDQEAMLNAGSWLVAAMKNIVNVTALEENLETVQAAMDVLKTVAENPLAPVTEEFKDAVKALNKEIADKGMLALRYYNAAYNASTVPELQYVVENVAEYQKSVADTYANLCAIKNDGILDNSLVVAGLAPADKVKFEVFKGILNGVIADLEKIDNADWGLVGNTDVLRADLTEAEYVLLYTMLADFNKTEITEIKETLNADKTTIRKNQSLVSVNVEVVLNAVQNNQVVESGKKTTVVSLRDEGATKDDIMAAIDASGVVAAAKSEWKLYVEEGFEDAKIEGLVDKLTKDINVTITFNPKYFEVTMSFETGAVELPYGTTITLPIHEQSATAAYDYMVNGTAYMQGETITITGKTDITRTEGPAYLTTTLYTAIAQTYGNSVAEAMVKSGALKGDGNLIYYRTPVIDDGLKLYEGELFAPTYVTANGNEWKPYSASFKDLTLSFGSANKMDWTENQALVQYALKLDAKAAEIESVLEMLGDVAAEYEAQKAAMNELATYEEDLKGLNKTILLALGGIIGGFEWFDENDKANDARIKEYLNNAVNGIKDNCLTGTNMTVYNIVTSYNGMEYYFQNSEYIRTEVAKLSEYVNYMLVEYDAVEKLLASEDIKSLGLGVEKYGEKLQKLGPAMERIAKQLAPVNANINLEDTKALRNLIAALDSGKMELKELGNGELYILSKEQLVKDSSARLAYAEITIDGVVYTVYTDDTVTYGEKLTQTMVDDLKAKIEKLIDEKLGDNEKYYNRVDDIKEKLQAGIALEEDLKISVTCEAKTYIVKIDGVADQQININDLVIDLPRYPSTGDTIDWVYIYFIDGEEETSATYIFTAEQLDTLFKNGVLEIKREARDEKARKLASFLTNMEAAGFYMDGDKMIAELELSAAGIEALAAGLMKGDYAYIGMNGEPFVHDAGNGLEIVLQTVLNAILNDETFSNQTIIDLGKNNGGKVLTTKLQLGLDENTLFENNLDFEIHLKSVPSQLITIANGLNAIKGNLTFKSDNGVLDVDVNLPEKVYELYLTALLVAGELDTSDMNAIDNEIAFRFLYDYVDFILGNDKITANTFQNTLDMLDDIAFDKVPEYNLLAYAKYLEGIRNVYNSVDIVTAPEAPITATVTTNPEGLNSVINGLGIDLSSVKMFIGMVKELNVKNDCVLTATAVFELKNTAKDFEAVIIDVDAAIEGGKDIVGAYKNGALKNEAIDLIKGQGLANAADYTSDLADRLTTVTGPAAIYLLSDVEGNLVINGTTIIDLNGFTIKGNIIANGKLLIVDSTISTADCGGVDGKISGNAFIVAGNYTTDVSKFLMDGYKQVGTSVQNAMYTFEVEGDNINLVLNSDFMDECDGWFPSIRALAADIAVDLALNFYFPASLTSVYGIGDNFNDILGLLDRHDIGEVADLALSLIDVEGISNIMNTLMADMMKFGAIADAIDNEKPMGGYTLTTMPWAVEFMHVYEEGVSDYLTVGIVAAEEGVKSKTVNITLVGDNIKKVVALLRELDRIIVDDETFITVDLKQPIRDGKFINIAGSADAHLSVDLTVDENYQTILAVIFAYGTPAKANALISALGDENALNAAFNDMTVREIIKSLGAMSRTVSFAEMAAAVGADITADAAELESLYHFVACAAGKALAKLESMNINGLVDRAENAADKAVDKFESYDDKELPTRFGDVAEKILDKLDLTTLKPIFDKAGNVIDRVIAKVDLDSKLGALDQGDGTYILQYAYSRSGDVEARGYGVNYNIESIHGLIKVKVFNHVDCLWGDANHDGEVNAKDASFVLQYSAGTIAADQFFCTLRTDVNGDGEINAKDASLILRYSAGTITKFPVEG